MKIKIILLTLISGTTALLIAQQTEYRGTAPGNPDAPYLLPNEVIKTQSVAPQQISPQNVSTQQISPQNFNTNRWNQAGTNWNSHRHLRKQEQEDLNIQQSPKTASVHSIASIQQ